MDLTCRELLSLINAIIEDENIDNLEDLKDFLSENGSTTIVLEKQI
jgi:hypothetical protein